MLVTALCGGQKRQNASSDQLLSDNDLALISFLKCICIHLQIKSFLSTLNLFNLILASQVVNWAVNNETEEEVLAQIFIIQMSASWIKSPETLAIAKGKITIRLFKTVTNLIYPNLFLVQLLLSSDNI